MKFSFNHPLLFTKYTVILFLLQVSFLTILAQPATEEKLALEYYQSAQYDKAAELFEQLYRKNPSLYFYNYYLNSLLADTKFSEAESFVKSVAKKNPTDVRYEVEIGYIYQMAGENRKAEKVFSNLVRKPGKTRDEFVYLSNAFRQRDLFSYALEVLEKGKGKFSPPLNIEIADIYQAKGDYNSMISTYLDLVHSSDEYINLVQGKFQLVISDFGSSKISEALREELLARTEKYPNKTIYAELLYWYSIQKQDFALALLQAKALDRQFGEEGNRVMELANILISNKQYKLASDAYRYILSLGKSSRFYQSAEINLLHTEYKSLTDGKIPERESLVKLKDDYETVLEKYGHNRTTVDLMRNLAQIKTFWLQQPSDGQNLLEEILLMAGLPREIYAETKMELGDILLFKGEKWSASLLYKQVEKEFKNDPIGFEAKFKAARFFYFVGEMEWAKVQLDVLKGATSKLIANDALELSLLIDENIDADSSYTTLSYFARADLLILQQQYTDAFLLFDTIEAIFPGHNILPFVHFRRAEVYKSLHQIDSALSFYEKVTNSFPYSSIADNALIMMARINDQELKDLPTALDLYSKLLIDYPGSLFTVEARKRFNELRSQPQLTP